MKLEGIYEIYGHSHAMSGKLPVAPMDVGQIPREFLRGLLVLRQGRLFQLR